MLFYPKRKNNKHKGSLWFTGWQIGGHEAKWKWQGREKQFLHDLSGQSQKQARVTGVKLVKSVRVKVSIQGTRCCVSEGTELQLAWVSPGRLVCSTVTRLTNTVLSTWMLLKVDHRYFHRKIQWLCWMMNMFVCLIQPFFLCIMPKHYAYNISIYNFYLSTIC